MDDLLHSAAGEQPSAQGRPLVGRLLLDGGFVSGPLLDGALVEQKKTNEQLGQVLVRLGMLEPDELAAVLSLQDDLAVPEAGIRLAAGVRQRLGDLLLRASRITQVQLEDALTEQRRTGTRLGDILVRRGLLERLQLDQVLAFQRGQSGGSPGGERLKLGEILVATTQISREQLDAALSRQRISGRKLGEELLAAGDLRPRQLDRALSLQERLVTAALVAVLSIGAIAAPQASAAETRHAAGIMQVSATVLPFARVQPTQQVSSLQITPRDVARGYVDVPSASVLEVKTNSRHGVILRFDNMAEFVKSIKVSGLGGEVELGASGGDVVERHSGYEVAGRALMLGYRFRLDPNAQPGTYTWPLMVSARPL